MNKWIKQLARKPKTLFAIDGLGALSSAFLLAVVLVRWESFFGIPVDILYLLASVPLVFAAYDLACFLILTSILPFHIRMIAWLNFAYCLLSLGLALNHLPSITIWGWIYLIAEILIVVLLAILELRLAKYLEHESLGR